MGRKTINSFEKVRVFGEVYKIKEPSAIPKVYTLKKEGTVCHIEMQDMEWLVKLAREYRKYEQLLKPVKVNLSGIIIHKGETEVYGFNEEVTEIADVVMRVTNLKSKSLNQIYILDCYEVGKSKCFVQTICDISKDVAEPYVLRPNPIPFENLQRIKDSSEIAAALLLGLKIYLNLEEICKFNEELARDEIPSEIHVRRISLFGREIV